MLEVNLGLSHSNFLVSLDYRVRLIQTQTSTDLANYSEQTFSKELAWFKSPARPYSKR